MKRILLTIIVFINVTVFSQDNKHKIKIDSLITVVSTIESDTQKISTLLKISNLYRNFETDKALTYCEKAINISKKIKNNKKLYDCYVTKGLINYRLGNNNEAVSDFNLVINNANKDSRTTGKAYLNLGNLYADLGKYDSSLIYYNNAKVIFVKLNEKGSEASVLTNIGTIYSDLGDYNKAISNYTKAQIAHKEYGNVLGQAACIENIGIIYYFQKDYNKSLEYFNSSLQIMRKVGRLDKMGNTLNNIASIYLIMGNTNEAINSFKEAENIYKQLNDKSGQAEILQNLSQLYFKSDKYKEGISALNTAISIFDEIGYVKATGECYKSLGSFYASNDLFYKAINNYEKSLSILEPLKVKNNLRELYLLLAEAHTKVNNFKKSAEFYKKFIVLNDTIFNADKSKLLAEMQTKYDTEKKAQELKIKSIQFEKEKVESKKKTIQRNFTFIGLILVIILIIIILRSYRQKQKANTLLTQQKHEITEKNEELNQQNEEITAQRDEIEKQKEIVEDIHYEISESINYATRLQQSILPEEKILSKYLSEHFVLFKPKDKVSGDFYWWAHVENHTVITAADCTGHGVPGAFMSMLGASFLREIVQKEYVTHTGVILRKLRKEIIKSLKQKDEIGGQKDGMDMAIISINHETNVVQFSGANNPLYIIKNEELKINDESSNAVKLYDSSNFWFYEIRPNKMPIAIYEKMDNFTAHEIQLEKDDQLYMFSDGFADQFGGTKGKKFKYKPFKKLLLENADKPMTEQKEILNSAFENWKGDMEQIDDVVVLGVRL